MKPLKHALNYLIVMFKIFLVILLFALPEAVICNGMPAGQALMFLVFCAVVLLPKRKKPATAATVCRHRTNLLNLTLTEKVTQCK